MPSNVAVHTISFRGKAGAIFVILCCAIVSFIVGFVTHSWSVRDGSERSGLWETCKCYPVELREGTCFCEIVFCLLAQCSCNKAGPQIPSLGCHDVLNFITRESSYCFQRVLAIAVLSVCLSVGPSVTRVDQSKTVQDRITKSSPPAA